MSGDSRRILKLSGPDTRDFLQGLVTNDVAGLDRGLVYAALLTPQGKYLADFFLVPQASDVLVDVDATLADMLRQRLNMYKLRAQVDLSEINLHVHRGVGAAPGDGFVDPRDPALGWRAYRDTPQASDPVDWDKLCVENIVPRTGLELHGDTFILEVGFERLAGVDFRKGCYVGQEVTARMKHKTELRKGLALVRLEGIAETGADIMCDGKVVGCLHTVAGDKALAYLRFDRVGEDMQAGDARVTLLERG